MLLDDGRQLLLKRATAALLQSKSQQHPKSQKLTLRSQVQFPKLESIKFREDPAAAELFTLRVCCPSWLFRNERTTDPVEEKEVAWLEAELVIVVVVVVVLLLEVFETVVEEEEVEEEEVVVVVATANVGPSE